MEREGREERGRREGGEMRRGIVIGGMVLGLLMGCNNGVAELERKNEFLGSVVNLGNEFLNVFTSFGGMISGSLGFKTESKKSDVANYFKKVQDIVEGTKITLNKIVSDMKEKGNSNASGVEIAVNKLVTETLDKIIDGAKIASSAVIGDDSPIANIGAQGSAGVAAKGDSVKSLVEGIEKIVDVVLKDIGNPDAGDKNKAETGKNARLKNGDDAGKLFANNNAGADAKANKAATDAAKAVGAVTGADILRAISKANGGAVELAKNAGDNNSVNSAADAVDATVAGAIALRAMAKEGKFANSEDADISASVKRTVVSAVTKALDTLTIAIRKTVDEGLKEVKAAMNINSNPVTSETGVAAK